MVVGERDALTDLYEATQQFEEAEALFGLLF